MSGAHALKKRTPVVVVAEDDAAIRRMIVEVLGDSCGVVEAADGMQALTAIKKMNRLPDLAIADVMMPRLDGLGLLKQLRHDTARKSIPVIILTAKSNPPDVISGINSGARRYLTKPFKHADHIDKVRKLLRI